MKSRQRENSAKRAAWRGALVGLGLAAAVVPTPEGAVERLYSAGAYLTVQPWITATSDRVPFALIDVLLVIVAGGWIVAAAWDLLRAARGSGWLRSAGALAFRTMVMASALYLGFLLMWGLNYRRVPLAEKLQFDADRASPEAARLLLATSVERVNALHEANRAHPGAAVSDPTRAALAGAFARVQRDLGARRTARPARPKHTLLDIYFRRAGVDGMTDPYFLETLTADDLLPFERPLVVAHEWSHLAGYADEGEANFVGWLTCLRSTEADQYSGWLFLYGEILRVVGGADARELARRLAPGPQADRRAIADRIRRNVSPNLSAAGWRVYDRYLKANRVEAGAASYAGVVRLALGARFGNDWTVELRNRN